MAIALSSHAAVEKVRIRFGFVIMTNPRDAQGLLSRHVTPPSPQAHFPTGALPHTPISPPAQTAHTTALNGATREHTHGAPSRAHGTERTAAPQSTCTRHHLRLPSSSLTDTARHFSPAWYRAPKTARRFGHAPFRARAEFGSSRQRRCRACSGARTRAHASAHDGALHSRTSFECAAPPLNGAIFLRCENMNASPDEGGTQRSSEVISDHQ